MWNYFCGGLGQLLMYDISLSVSRPGLSHGAPVPSARPCFVSCLRKRSDVERVN
jgi:hypothetical protein